MTDTEGGSNLHGHVYRPIPFTAGQIAVGACFGGLRASGRDGHSSQCANARPLDADLSANRNAQHFADAFGTLAD